MQVMILAPCPNTPDDALVAQWAVIVDSLGRVLPHTFENALVARHFLDAAERVGASIYHDMPRSELAKMVALWNDAYKRS